MSEKIKKFTTGGTSVPGRKELSCDRPTKTLSFPDRVIIPLGQHIGKPGKVIVSEGENVLRGQPLTREQEGFSARIHASIAGKVTAIKEMPIAGGIKSKSIIIENKSENQKEVDFEKEIIGPRKDFTPDTIRDIIRRAGIIGMGGAGFPTQIKLNPPEDKKIDTVIINGAECEPYITVDDRTLQEKTKEVYQGLEYIRKTVGASQGFIACEENKPKALKALHDEEKNWDNLSCVTLDSRYPHGAEKKLIEAVLQREIPLNGLPLDVGVIVNNVQTTVAITEALTSGHPLIDRTVTVSGRGIKQPENLRVPIGTPVQYLIDNCGGFNSDEIIPLMGGPMTGLKIQNMEIPITKTSIGIIILTPDEYQKKEFRVCIRCGKCVDVCPVYITPNRITDYINNEFFLEAVDLGLKSCIECGACAYVCPSKRPLLKWLKKGKAACRKINI